MSFWTYILRCGDGSYYVGHTDHLEQRLGQHQQGLVAGYTATHKPLTLVWQQDFTTREDALSAELQIKRWSRAKKEALIRGDWPALRQAARKRFRPS